MKGYFVAIILTIVNLALLVGVLTHRHAAAQNVPAVLRGRALEIVDERGRVRAKINIEPTVTTDGKTYPETVMLRLIDPNGRPEVKLGASEAGAGLGLVGDS